MSESKIPRGEFRNPCPHLSNAAANTAVESLLSTVQEAYERFGEPTKEDYEIAALSLPDLQELLVTDRALTMTHVVEARIRLAVKASLTTHCLTAFPYKQALEAAQRIQLELIEDSEYDHPRELIAACPLLGLVFSVKDCIHVEGYPSTLGCSSRVDRNEEASADLVQTLIFGEAIMIAKTTVPQLMMSNTTHSPLWGTTRSPVHASATVDGQDDEFQVGGSSGGEAALVKMGGSQLGVGTDMGGSVRQPACLNELCGYKFTSTSDKFRWKLAQDFMTGLPHTAIPATAPGFLARNVSTLKPVVEYLYNEKYHNFKQPDEQDWEDVYEDWEAPQPEDLGNSPRIVYTTQQSSPEVDGLVHWLLEQLETGKALQLARPTRCDALGDVDLGSWAEVWTEHAKQHGFDEARAILGDDPLIMRTLFDESRLSPTDANRGEWKVDDARLSQLKATFLRQAGLVENEEEGENKVIFITPTYTLGGPVKNTAFVQLDDAGGSEIWCELFNLLDWPSISIPLPKLGAEAREQLRQKALDSPEWGKHLPGLVRPDPIGDQTSDRLAHLSLQLATTPRNQLALLDYAERITNSVC